MTKVSVVMAVYNGQRYVREAVESILNQTYTDFEFIIVDDCSRDNTPAILRSFMDPRLRIITLETNIGQTSALNQSLQLARGPYIARIDADDLSLPERLAQQVVFLDKHPEVGLLGTEAIIIDEFGQEVDRFNIKITNEELQRDSLLGNPFVHGSAMFRQECLAKTEDYNPVYKHAQDYDLWLRMAEWYAVHNLAEPLYLYRIHPDSMTSTKKAAMDSEAEHIIAETIARRNQGKHQLGALHVQALARYYFQQAVKAYAEEQYGQGQQHLLQALEIDSAVLKDANFVSISYQLPQAGQQLDATLPRCQAAIKFIDTVMFSNGHFRKGELSAARKQLLDHFLPGAVFEANQIGQLQLARRLAKRAIINNPVWLRNRGLVSIWFKGMVGVK